MIKGVAAIPSDSPTTVFKNLRMLCYEGNGRVPTSGRDGKEGLVYGHVRLVQY